jgi:hypothetical protein
MAPLEFNIMKSDVLVLQAPASNDGILCYLSLPALEVLSIGVYSHAARDLVALLK